MRRWFPSPPHVTSKAIAASCLVTILLIVCAGYVFWQTRPTMVIITGLDQEVSFETKSRDLGTAMTAAGIAVASDDLVTPPLSVRLRPKSTVRVKVIQAIPVTLIVGGQPTEVRTHARSVAGLLQEQGVSVAAKDRVTPDAETQIQRHSTVRIVTVREELRTNEVSLPYHTIRREDRMMTLGEVKELQPGVPGAKSITERVTLEDGVEVLIEVVDEKITAAPVDQVVAFGTISVVSRGGTDYRYSQAFEMTATGYTAGKESNPNGNGHTYTGIPAVHGVVAVDPRVIPLNSRLYVEGYGPAIAADIGGAIKGNKIDLCFDSVAEALQWGRRPVKVYLLDG